MFNAISVFAAILSVVCAVLIQHVLIRFNKVEEGYESWSQSLSDDCNRNLQAYYTMLYDAMKKDVIAYFDKIESNEGSIESNEGSIESNEGSIESNEGSMENPIVEDLSDVESYIEENDVKITLE